MGLPEVQNRKVVQPPAPALRLCRLGCFEGGPGSPKNKKQALDPPKTKNRVMIKGVPDSVLMIRWGQVLLLRGWRKFGARGWFVLLS